MDIDVSFFASDMPGWMCPTCGRGILELAKQVHHVSQLTANSHEAMQHDAFEPDWLTEHGVFSLQCTNPQCKESVSLVAHGRVEEHWDHRLPQEYQQQFSTRFRPVYFDPPIHWFAIPEGTPDDVRAAIVEAFSLVWSHPDAAGNALRRGVELLMDHVKIKRRTRSKKNKKLESLTLHARIELFSKKDAQNGERLLAIKWLGNAGSHTKESLCQADVVDGFEFLEVVLGSMFSSSQLSVDRKVRQIVQRKGPRKRGSKPK